MHNYSWKVNEYFPIHNWFVFFYHSLGSSLTTNGHLPNESPIKGFFSRTARTNCKKASPTPTPSSQSFPFCRIIFCVVMTTSRRERGRGRGREGGRGKKRERERRKYFFFFLSSFRLAFKRESSSLFLSLLPCLWVFRLSRVWVLPCCLGCLRSKRSVVGLKSRMKEKDSFLPSRLTFRGKLKKKTSTQRPSSTVETLATQEYFYFSLPNGIVRPESRFTSYRY